MSVDIYEDNGPDEPKLVAKGAELLDKILPGWHNEIVLEDLDMSSGAMCMMGQLFGTSVESQLAKEMYPEEMRNTDGDLEGFIIAGTHLGITRSLIGKLMRKAGLRLTSAKSKSKFIALQHVCSGHDNRCLWAEEIATRRAKEWTHGKG